MEETDPVAPETVKGAGRWWAIGGVVALLAVAIVVGLLLTNGGDKKPPRALPETPVSSDPTDILPAGSTLVAPASVIGKIVDDKAVFTWDPVDAATSYSWVSGSDGGEAKRPRVTIPLSPTGRTCIFVRSRTETDASQDETRGCIE